jgi:hypothetical protein
MISTSDTIDSRLLISCHSRLVVEENPSRQQPPAEFRFRLRRVSVETDLDRCIRSPQRMNVEIPQLIRALPSPHR